VETVNKSIAYVKLGDVFVKRGNEANVSDVKQEVKGRKVLRNRNKQMRQNVQKDLGYGLVRGLNIYRDPHFCDTASLVYNGHVCTSADCRLPAIEYKKMRDLAFTGLKKLASWIEMFEPELNVSVSALFRFAFYARIGRDVREKFIEFVKHGTHAPINWSDFEPEVEPVEVDGICISLRGSMRSKTRAITVWTSKLMEHCGIAYEHKDAVVPHWNYSSEYRSEIMRVAHALLNKMTGTQVTVSGVCVPVNITGLYFIKKVMLSLRAIEETGLMPLQLSEYIYRDDYDLTVGYLLALDGVRLCECENSCPFVFPGQRLSERLPEFGTVMVDIGGKKLYASDVRMGCSMNFIEMPKSMSRLTEEQEREFMYHANNCVCIRGHDGICLLCGRTECFAAQDAAQDLTPAEMALINTQAVTAADPEPIYKEMVLKSHTTYNGWDSELLKSDLRPQQPIGKYLTRHGYSKKVPTLNIGGTGEVEGAQDYNLGSTESLWDALKGKQAVVLSNTLHHMTRHDLEATLDSIGDSKVETVFVRDHDTNSDTFLQALEHYHDRRGAQTKILRLTRDDIIKEFEMRGFHVSESNSARKSGAKLHLKANNPFRTFYLTFVRNVSTAKAEDAP
jgi:hypothetical protein